MAIHNGACKNKRTGSRPKPTGAISKRRKKQLKRLAKDQEVDEYEKKFEELGSGIVNKLVGKPEGKKQQPQEKKGGSCTDRSNAFGILANL